MYVKFANGSEAKAGVPVKSGVSKSVLAAIAIASHRELMTVTLRRQRGAASGSWCSQLDPAHPCCQMEDTQYTLNCFVLGEEDSFPVKIKKDQSVSELKQEIKKGTQRLALIDSHILDLYRLNVAGPDKQKRKHEIESKAKALGSLVELESLSDVSDYFGDSDPPKKRTVHILVVPPQGKSIDPWACGAVAETRPGEKRKLTSGNSPPGLQEPSPKRRHAESEESQEEEPPLESQNPGFSTLISHIAQREKTVSGLHDLLLEHNLVQVRGSPGSGKSTLLNLLHDHIHTHHPDAKIQIFRSWKARSLEHLSFEKRIGLRKPYNRDCERYFLFDDGQYSYWDDELLNWFKDVCQVPGTPKFQAILFCSHDSYPNPGEGTLPVFQCKVRDERVTRIPGGDQIGLKLDKDEYQDVYRSHEKTLSCDEALRDQIYTYAGGHVASIKAIFYYLTTQRGPQMMAGEIYTLDNFFMDLTNPKGFYELVRTHYALRTFPPSSDIQNFAPAVQELLKNDQLNRDYVNEETKKTLDTAYRRGYIQLNELNDQQCYCFASPLIQFQWSWLLNPPLGYVLPYQNLLDLIKAALELFRPNQLRLDDRRTATNAHRPPEAQYQVELYRCLHGVTGGSVRVSLEYATAKGPKPGRLDFFLPEEEWGIELTRDGSNLQEHADKFGPNGASGQSIGMTDYVLIDCRLNHPRTPHTNIPSLFHAVFSEEPPTLTILNNRCQVIHECNLLHNRPT